MRFLALVRFHLRLYAKNTYFLMTMSLATLTMVLYQYLAAYSQGEALAPYAWLRAGIFGLWASGTTAAGVVGMQRWQGTLRYLLNNPYSDYGSLCALVLPAALFGLLAFPLSAILVLVLGQGVNMSWTTFLAILALWLGASLLDLCIATLFVYTNNALIYEELISLPLLLLSGLFQLPSLFAPLQEISRFLVPITLPIHWLLGYDDLTLVSLGQYLVSLILSASVAFLVMRSLLKGARQRGEFGGNL